MHSRFLSTLVGLAVYALLVLFLYTLHRIAVSGTVQQLYPLWYSAAELLLKGATAVAPGFAAGWVFRHRGFSSGALVGGIGGLIEVLVMAAADSVSFGSFASRIAVGAVSTALANAMTNSAGSVAGAYWRARTARPEPEGAEPAPEAKRRRRSHRSSSSS